MKVKFHKNNKIIYGQDFTFYQGIPHDVEFEANNFNGYRMRLVGEGYGKMGNYGNGAIFVNKKDMPDMELGGLL